MIAEEFLEELIVRRELAFNFARSSPALSSLDALPDWARATLAKHDKDRREFVYSRDQFERAATHDELWNAAQTELLTRGVIHGYYRMYWGKKIIEWSASHAEALATMIYLNDRDTLDGRDPNPSTNILWCFGLHDRPWAERPIFGMIRYMSLDGMRRKTDTDGYIQSVTQAKAHMNIAITGASGFIGRASGYSASPTWVKLRAAFRPVCGSRLRRWAAARRSVHLRRASPCPSAGRLRRRSGFGTAASTARATLCRRSPRWTLQGPQCW